MTRAPESPGMRLASALALLAVALHLTVSANLLRVAGIDYAHDGGSPFSRFHPATFLIFASLACLAASADGRRGIRSTPPGLLLFPLAMVATMLLSAASVGVSGDTVYVESYLSAGLLAIVSRTLPVADARRIARLAASLIALNVAIALGESALSTHLVPIFLEDRTLSDPPSEFRPAALFDHPLTAASATLVSLLVLPDLGLGRGRARLACVFPMTVFLMTGLVAFGERTPLALGLFFTCLRVARETGRRLLERRITGAELGLATSLIMAAGTAAAAATWSTDRGAAAWAPAGGGFGGRLAAHLTLDASASARLDQWRVLGLLDLRGWLIGTPIAEIPGLVYKIGLSRPLTGIESFWLFALLDLGLIGFILWAAGLFCFLREIWRGASRAGRSATLALLLAASCSNSLGRKCNLLVVLVACVAAPQALPRRGQPV